MLIRLNSGLGNQMFIYAFARALSLRGYSVTLDATGYIDRIHPDSLDINQPYIKVGNTKQRDARLLELSLFNIQLPLCFDINYINNYLYKHDKKLKRKVIAWKYIERTIDLFQNNFRYIKPQSNELKKIINKNIPLSMYKHRLKEPLMNIKNPCMDSFLYNNFNPHSYIEGYFQNLVYFENIDSIIRKEFSLKTPLQSHNKELKTKIEKIRNSVFMHVRLGDYITDGGYVHLGKTYYQNAIDTIKEMIERPYIFVFSNDIEWCEKNLFSLVDFSGCDVDFVKGNSEGNAAEEMELMRSCKHGIIANSTFSWWAAYLMDNSNKKIIMPTQFLNNLDMLPQANMLAKENFIRLNPFWGGGGRVRHGI